MLGRADVAVGSALGQISLSEDRARSLSTNQSIAARKASIEDGVRPASGMVFRFDTASGGSLMPGTAFRRLRSSCLSGGASNTGLPSMYSK